MDERSCEAEGTTAAARLDRRRVARGRRAAQPGSLPSTLPRRLGAGAVAAAPAALALALSLEHRCSSTSTKRQNSRADAPCGVAEAEEGNAALAATAVRLGGQEGERAGDAGERTTDRSAAERRDGSQPRRRIRRFVVCAGGGAAAQPGRPGANRRRWPSGGADTSIFTFSPFLFLRPPG